jgi:4-amino-4-deoxy-L-arabinose transferase-like glycosyltransferase
VKAPHRTVSVDRFLLALILAVALLARFRYLTQIEHNIDHAYPVWQALRTLDRGIFPLTGQATSVLFDNPALTGYLFIPAVALTRSPLGVYLFVVSLNWLGVLLAYRAARSLLGSRLALIAAGLMAVNPWVIEYSRTSWVQSLLPFFVCALAWLLWPVLMGQSRRPVRRTAAALIVATMLTQTYLLAFLIVLPVGILLLIFRHRVPLRGVVIGGSVFVIATTLYGAGLLAKWDDVQQRVEEFSSGDSRLTLDAWNHAVRLVTGDQYEVARRRDAPDSDFKPRHDATTVAHTALLGTLLLGIGGAGYALYAGKLRKVPLSIYGLSEAAGFRGGVDAAIIALVWFGLPVLAMSYTANLIHPTYQLLGLPAGYVLAAWGLGLIFRPARTRWGGIALIALAIPFAALMLTNSARHYQSIKANPGLWDLGAQPLGVGLKTGAMIDRYLTPDGVVFADAPEWTLNSFSGRLFPVIRDTRAPAFSTVPAQGGLYIAIDTIAPPLPYGATRVETLPLSDGKIISFDQFPSAAEVALPEHRLEIPSHQGLTLVGYDLSREQESWTLTTVWRVDFVANEVYERIYGPFLHVIDAEGNQVLNLGGEGLEGARWQPGDLHIHQITFTLPDDAPGPFTLHTGQYDGLHNANVIFQLPDGANAVITLPETLSP